jgi:hypothetical protein
MTSLALSLALVAVALVARDVVLRVLVDRARERGGRRADAARIEQAHREIAALAAERRTGDEALAALCADLRTDVAALRERVERLDARESLTKMGRR